MAEHGDRVGGDPSQPQQCLCGRAPGALRTASQPALSGSAKLRPGDPTSTAGTVGQWVGNAAAPSGRTEGLTSAECTARWPWSSGLPQHAPSPDAEEPGFGKQFQEAATQVGQWSGDGLVGGWGAGQHSQVPLCSPSTGQHKLQGSRCTESRV